ncbi:MAG: class I SAM-dependent methyltransferase [Planctomycetota bacterium]|jgi:SAM-dependent methyltransferase
MARRRRESPRAEFEEFPGDWYLMSDENHLWMQWRLAVFLSRLKRLSIETTVPARGLDVGAGMGTFRAQLEAETAWTVDGVELNQSALAMARPARGEMFSFDILGEPPEHIGKYDHLFLFDVVEHVAKPRPFIESALSYLKKGGFIHVNVPALRSFFSAYDQAAGHFRRYDRRSLRDELAGLGVETLDLAYWGFALLPALLWRKIAVARKTGQREIIRTGFAPPHPWIHAALKTVMRLESRLLRHPPVGSSLMLIGRKS